MEAPGGVARYPLPAARSGDGRRDDAGEDDVGQRGAAGAAGRAWASAGARHLLRAWAGVEVVEGTLLCDGLNQDAIDAAVPQHREGTAGAAGRVAMRDVLLLQGDCIEAMAKMPSDSVDAIVTDPPYGLSAEPDAAEVLRHWLAGDDYTHRGGGFMGKTWDSFVPGPATWKEALRVLKPGGYALVFAGTRTADLMGMSLRLAGFEVRDCFNWLYGSGFPKSLNLPGGLGTALKPAHEPIIVARKPLIGTVAANVLAHGTGAMNIDACRVPGQPSPAAERRASARASGNAPMQERVLGVETAEEANAVGRIGRWPANLLLTHDAGCAEGACAEGCPVAALDAQTGTLKSGKMEGDQRGWGKNGIYGEGGKTPATCYADEGGASRFFNTFGYDPEGLDAVPFRYVAKAAGKEREAGLEGDPEITARTPMAGRGQGGLKCRTCGKWKASGSPCTCAEPDFEQVPFERKARLNTHPTVKPVALMRWLVRLVNPSGGVVLDPFLGSGTTLVAATLEGVRAIGVEREAAYIEIAKARVAHARKA